MLLAKTKIEAAVEQTEGVEINEVPDMFNEPIPNLVQGEPGGIYSWWVRLKHLAESVHISPALNRAHTLLQDWLNRADKLPVHDLLDHIYFSADVPHRYAAALPAAMRATVQANLQALLEVALDVDGGRYPSLPGFLASAPVKAPRS